MEKMMWTKPEMNEFAFAANEYVSTCYSGKCDTRAGWIGIGQVGDAMKILYKFFFAWNDLDKDGNAKTDEVDLSKVVNMNNVACNKEFNAEGTYQTVASPNTYFYDDNGVWKPKDQITDNTVWETAYQFEGKNWWGGDTTHLCENLLETSKS